MLPIGEGSDASPLVELVGGPETVMPLGGMELRTGGGQETWSRCSPAGEVSTQRSTEQGRTGVSEGPFLALSPPYKPAIPVRAHGTNSQAGDGSLRKRYSSRY